MSDAPPTPDAPPADRSAVLAWMAAEKRGYKAAAAHFGLSVDTVKSWDRRAKNGEGEAAKSKVEPKVVKAAAKVEAKPASSPSRPRVVEAIGPELRASLRRGVAGLSRFVALAGDAVPADASDPAAFARIPDMQQVAHAARALDILLARVPEVMTFDQATTPAEDKGAGRDERIAAVFGQAPAPALTPIAGGRASGA